MVHPPYRRDNPATRRPILGLPLPFEAALALLEANEIDCTTTISDKGVAVADFEAAAAELGMLLLRPNRKDEPDRPNPPIGWIPQRIESIVDTLKDQLLLERHGVRTPAGLLTRIQDLRDNPPT